MKIQTILTTLLYSLILCLPSYALEDVILDMDDEVSVFRKFAEELQEPVDPSDGLTLTEKLLNIKSKEISDTSKSKYLLEEILTYKPEKSPVETVHFFGMYRSDLDIDIDYDDTDVTHNFTELNAGINGRFRNGKTYYEARFRLKPQNQYGFFQYLPSNLYIANTSIPHHTVLLGNTRTPTGYEGALSTTMLPFVARAQISRNFGNIRKVGLRVKGSYDFIDYDLGGYSSDTYFRKFFPGAEFSGWATLKPLAKTKGKYGDLRLGGGITAGQNDIDYCVSGAYAGYQYENFTADFEWAKANGYNGSKLLTSNHAEGFYSTLGYKITPKIQLVARYDQFTPNLNNPADKRREYSTGINYFIKGQALKVMLNYVFCQNDVIKDSHRIIVGTQILL